MEKQNIFIAVGLALFAVFAACAKWLNKKDKDPQKTLIGEAVTAAFAGILIYFVYMWMGKTAGVDVSVAFILAGLAGWGGAKVIDSIGRFAAQKGGVSITMAGKQDSEKEDQS